MISFLILPMQRVTRLPLLMDVRAPSLLPAAGSCSVPSLSQSTAMVQLLDFSSDVKSLGVAICAAW